jgi:hypothetical protein
VQLKNFSLQLSQDEDDLLDTQAAVDKQVRCNASARELEMATLEMKFCLTQQQEPLDLTSIGKLSSVSIIPYNLSTFLQQVTNL